MECCCWQAEDKSSEFVAQHYWVDTAADAESEDEAQGSACVDALSTELKDVALLRGTGLKHILRGLGRHLRSSELSAAEGDELYGKSRPVEEIDCFISHSWSDPRASKVYALWIHSHPTLETLYGSFHSNRIISTYYTLVKYTYTGDAKAT